MGYTMNDAGEFLHRVDEIVQDEAKANLILGVALTIERSPEIYPDYDLFVVTRDDTPVSLSGYGKPTGSGVHVGPVYTPPGHRRRGYAAALVAYETQWLLDSGYRLCFLYTDLGNPTSNESYKRIGYHQVAESAMYRFG